jgi:hypothetical protein
MDGLDGEESRLWMDQVIGTNRKNIVHVKGRPQSLLYSQPSLSLSSVFIVELIKDSFLDM